MNHTRASADSRLPVPNLLSGFRLLAAPLMLVLAWFGKADHFLILLVISLVTDALDGFLARRFNWQSTLGTKLDSWGDFATYATVPLAAWWLWPEILKREAVYVWLAIAAYALPILIGFVKYRRLTSYHTWAAKATAVIMGIGALLLFWADIAWPFRSAAVIQVLEAAEEIAITLIMPKWANNIPTLWHARRQIASKKIKDGSKPGIDSGNHGK